MSCHPPVGDTQHPAVHVRRDAGHHSLRWRAQPGRPRAPDQIVVAADPAGGDDHCLRTHLEVADAVRVLAWPRSMSGLEDRPADPGDHPALGDQLVHPVAQAQVDAALLCGGADASLEGLHDAGSGPPGQMEPGHRVAVAVGPAVAALRPADDWEEPMALGMQPLALLRVGEVQVRLGPRARPVILGSVELGAAEPVLRGRARGCRGCPSAAVPGSRRGTARRGPEGLTAEALLGLLVKQDHPPPGIRRLRGGHEPGQSGAHHDDVGIHRWPSSPVRPAGRPAGQTSTPLATA